MVEETYIVENNDLNFIQKRKQGIKFVYHKLLLFFRSACKRTTLQAINAIVRIIFELRIPLNKNVSPR